MLNEAYVVLHVDILTLLLPYKFFVVAVLGSNAIWHMENELKSFSQSSKVYCEFLILFGCQSVIKGLISHAALPHYSSSFCYCLFYLPAVVVEYPFWSSVSGREFLRYIIRVHYFQLL